MIEQKVREVLLAGVVGSTAYGLERPGSDIDRLGVHAAPTVAFHGLNPPTGRAAARHLRRLLTQGTHLWRTGELEPLHAQADEVFRSEPELTHTLGCSRTRSTMCVST